MNFNSLRLPREFFIYQDIVTYTLVSDRKAFSTVFIKALEKKGNTAMENVIKQGYLKKGTTGGHWFTSLFKRNDGQKWFVFTVRNGVPYLEYYDSDVEVFSQRPINSFCLSSCHSIRPMARSSPPTFCINCSDRFIELVASSRNQMSEWVHSIETSLIRLGILKKESEGNVYTVLSAVVRQPRVSKEVEEERDSMAAQAAASSSIPAQATGASSSEQMNLSPNLDIPSGSTAVEIPPPVPKRPPPSVFKVNPEDNDSNHVLESFSTPVGSEGLAAMSPSYHESNSSDFVSWDVLMSIKEASNSLRRSNSKREGSTSDTELPVSRSVSCYSSFPTRTNCYSEKRSHPTDDGNLSFEPQEDRQLELENNCSDESFNLSDSMGAYSLGFSQLQPNLSGLDMTNRLFSDEGNEYSMLPGNVTNHEQSKEDKKIYDRPVPLPRRALSLKNDYDNTSVVDSAISLRDAIKASHQFEKSVSVDSFLSQTERELTRSNGYNLDDLDEAEDGSHDTTTLLCRPVKEETFLKLSQFGTSRNEADNLYSPVLKRGEHEIPTTMAPPIPSLSTSSGMVSPKDQFASGDSSKEFYCTNVSSLPLTADPSKSSFTLVPKNDPLSSDQCQQPPVPLPRRKPTTFQKSNSSFYLNNASGTELPDIPPLPPRRSSPKFARAYSADNPPSLPSRSTQSFFIKRPQISNLHNKSEDANTKSNVCLRALPPLPPSEDQEQSARATNGASNENRTLGSSGLSHKMLLDRAHSLHTVVSLKQTQVEILQNEIDMPHITVSLTQKSGHGLALVDWNGLPCIAGWNQKNFPTLHGKLHIGDIILSVNSIPAASPEVTQKLLRQPVSSKIEVNLQRMPYAKVFAIRRNAEGQSLGLKREGGTGELLYVDPNGLAAQHGLTAYVQGGFGGARCNWFLTEINSRPLNLFFKENEIEHRLCAVGREISIVVQPSDFIFEIRRQLKKVKNYKNFIVQ